jgi:3-oxoacyl-[acyl-carrier-protein] synthase III
LLMCLLTTVLKMPMAPSIVHQINRKIAIKLSKNIRMLSQLPHFTRRTSVMGAASMPMALSALLTIQGSSVSD